MSICSRCSTTRDLVDFYRLKSGKPRSWCKVCEAAYKHQRQQTPAYKAWRTDYKSAHPAQWGNEYMTPAPSDADQLIMAYA